VRLTQNLKGISKLAVMFLLIIFFLLGATLSYIWTMGFYAPREFNLPSQTNITIEDVKFFTENATFFNVTVLNPSYSPSTTTIEQIKIETSDGKLHDTMTPSLPIPLARGTSQTFQSFWNWGNYTGQTVRLHAFVSGGLGSNVRASTPFMNFSVVSVNLNPSVSAKHFNITVQNAGSSTPVNITRILVDGANVLTVPTLVSPYGLDNSSTSPPVTFMVNQTWIDLQGKNVAVAVQTIQGYTAFKTENAPLVSLGLTSLVFDKNNTSRFTVMVVNNHTLTQPAYVTINEVEIAAYWGNGTLDKVVVLNSTKWVAIPSQNIDLNILFATSVVCSWDWSEYLGKGATVTVTVRTIQGFQTPPRSGEKIP